MHLWRKLADSREEATHRNATTKNSMTRLNTNMRRLAIAPAMRLVNGSALEDKGSVAEASCLVAELLPRPKTLHDLWKEYQFGGPGRKAAKDFTPAE